MPTKKYKQKLMKHRLASISRIVACASFLILTIIGVSSIVRAMSLEDIANENGIPAIWQAASLGNPDTITVPITYWDQREDDCSDPNRQFEWSLCRLYAKGIIRNVVKSQLGADGLPVPTYNNSTDAWNAYHDVFTANVIGNDPVQPTDNFYRWFHETYDANGKQLSKQYNREVVFKRIGNNSYEYGSKGTFPLDDVDFSNDDAATKEGHNFHFTAHMSIPMKISTDGTEEFWFSGDDDVWVFLNGQLVLDLGGLHMDTEGSFTIDRNGNVISTIDNVNVDQACRQSIPDPRTVGYDIYNSQLENKCPRQPITTTFYTNFQPGEVVNLDFFYAERSTSESNTRIHITNMNWPISADSNITAKEVGKIPNSDNYLIQYNTNITNRDPANPLILERLAAYIHEDATNSDGTTITSNGFLPLDSTTLYYTTTPDDENSWQPVEISAPDNTANGFNLATPITLAPNGQPGDTLYFRYFAETSTPNGTMSSTVSYYTSLEGVSGVTYDNTSINYEDAPHNLTIHYRYEDDTEAAPSYVASLKPNQEFSIDSPDVEEYIPEITTVVGKMQDQDQTYIVYYKRKPVDEPTPDKYTVTILYVYEDGTTAADPYVETLDPDTEFDIPSPEINGFTPDLETVTGKVVDDNLEYIVRYSRVPTIDQPVIPSHPGSDIIGGDLIYVAPLGEVAYVPNTGVISNAIASVFELDFAEVVLSQAFVMSMLAIFAGSFAIYFSNRKFLAIAPATANTTPSNRKAKSSSTVRKATAKRTPANKAKTMTSAKRTISRKGSIKK